MLQVRLLGQLDVRAAGRRVCLPSRSGQSLLAYLLLTAGTAHRRERLAGLCGPTPPTIKSRKLIVHNPNLTLVRLNADELTKVGKLVADKLNQARGLTQVFIPLRGFSYPDREGFPHWDPEGNQAFIDSLKVNMNPSIPLTELDAHINDPEFIDPVIETFLTMMRSSCGVQHV